MKRLPHISFILVLLALIILLYSATRGLTYHDEGYILNSAYRMIQGEVPYRDFHFAYTPLAIFITSLFYEIGNVSVISERFAAICISLLSLSCLYYLAGKTIKNKWIQALVLLGFVVWGPLHINFVWPVMLAISFSLAMMVCLYLAKEKHNLFFLSCAGVFMVLTFLSKQNFGLAGFFILILTLYMLKPAAKKEGLLYLIPGILVTVLLFLLYLLLTNSYIPFVNDFLSYTVQRIVISHSLTTPFIYPSSVPVMIIKTCIYMIPLVLGFATLLRGKTNPFVGSIGIYTVLFYLLGIRPTTDYIHLVPLLAIAALPLGILADRTHTKIGICVLFLFAVVGFMRGFYTNYYKWEAPLSSQNILLKIPSSDIYTSAKISSEVTSVSEYARSKHIKSLFIYEYAPLFYLLSGSRNPTPYDLIDQSDFYKPYQQEIIHILTEKRTNTIITGYSIFEDTTEIGRYIKQTYSIHKVLYDHIVWIK